MMDDLMKRLLLVELRRAGYSDAYYSEGDDSVFPMDKVFPGIQIKANEFRMPPLEQPDQQRQRDLVYDAIRPITAKAEEMAYVWNNAAPMKIDSDDTYRLLSEHGKHVFAARDDGAHGLHFVTWEYDYNRTGVSHGRYTTDYEAAKLDFAVRSGLFPENMFFASEEIRQIYSALVYQGKNDDELTFQQGQDINAVLEKLEWIDPELKQPQGPMEQDSIIELGVEQ